MAATIAVLGGSVAVAGWVFGETALETFFPGQLPIKLNTIPGFILSGISLWALQQTGTLQSFGRARRRLGQLVAVFVTVLGLMSLNEYISGLDLELGDLLFRAFQAKLPPTLTRSSLPSALDFVFIGSGLLLLEVGVRAGRRPTEYLGFATLLGGMFGVMDFVFHPSVFSTGVALNSALLDCVMGGGLLCARPGRGYIRLLSSRDLGGTASRRLLPAAILVPLLFGWLMSRGLHAGLYDWELGVMLLDVSSVATLIAVVVWTGVVLSRTDQERLAAHDELRDRARQEAAVASLGQMALAGGSLDTLMAKAVAAISQTLETEYSKVLEFLPEENALLLRTGVGWKAGIVGHATVSAGSESQAGCALLSGEPIVVEDLPSDPSFTASPLLRAHGVVSGLSVAIPGPRRRYGVLGAHTARRRKFSSDDVRFLQAVALMLATALERQHADEALQRQAEIIDQVHDAVVSTDLDGYVTSWNLGAVRLFGYTAEEALRQHISFVYPQDQRRFLEEEIIKPLKEKGDRDVEVRMLRKSGEQFYAHVSLALLRDRQGNALGMIGYSMDITERKHAEEARSYLASIVASSNDAIIGRSVEGVIQSWNHGAERLYGYTAQEAIGQPITLVIPPDRSDEFVGPDRIRRGEQIEQTETVRVGKDGRRIDVSVVISPMRDAAGRVIGAATIARDITERKRAQEALRRAGAYNRSLIEASLDPLVTISPDGKITDANTAAEKVTGFTRQELVGADFSGYFTEPERAQAGYQQVFREGWVQDYELAIRHRDGHIVPVLYNASVYRDEAGQVVGVFAAARDISERKRAEREMGRLNRAYRTLSDCNEVIVRAQGEQELLYGVCGILVKVGGYRMAWVGYAEQDAARTVRPVASAGIENGYLEAAWVTWADTERGRGPTGRAIRMRQPSIGRNVQRDPDFAPWREEAGRRGYASSIGLPLFLEDQTLGALTLYSEAVDAFDEREVALLKELAQDLSFGIKALRTHLDQKRAEEELRQLSARLLHLRDEEQRRIARELHDSTGQSLAALGMNLDWVQQQAAGLTPQAHHLLAESSEIVNRCTQEIRDFSYLLHPPTLEEYGLASAVRWYVEGFARRSGIRTTIEVPEDLPRLSQDKEIALFRVVQECLTNVYRHSGSPTVRVRIVQQPKSLSVEIADEGCGFQSASLEAIDGGRRLGVGILGMRERMSNLGGSFEIASDGRGATVLARLPIEEKET